MQFSCRYRVCAVKCGALVSGANSSSAAQRACRRQWASLCLVAVSPPAPCFKILDCKQACGGEKVGHSSCIYYLLRTYSVVCYKDFMFALLIIRNSANIAKWRKLGQATNFVKYILGLLFVCAINEICFIIVIYIPFY